MNEPMSTSLNSALVGDAPRYDTTPFVVNKPWPIHWQLLVALLGGAVPAAVLASINVSRLGMPSSRKLLCHAVGVLSLVAMVMVASHRIELLGLTTGGQKFRAVQLSSLMVGGLAWMPLALIQLPSLLQYQREGKAFGKMWAPGLCAAVAFGVPQRFLVWAAVMMMG